MPPEVHALLFDTYGTVVDWRPAVLAALVEVGRARGLTVDWEQVLADWEPRPIQDRVNVGRCVEEATAQGTPASRSRWSHSTTPGNGAMSLFATSSR